MVMLVPHRPTAVGMSKAKSVPHGTTWLGTQLTTGGVVSTTVMDWLQVKTLVQAFVTDQVRMAVNRLDEQPAVKLVIVLTMTGFKEALVPQVSVNLGSVKS